MRKFMCDAGRDLAERVAIEADAGDARHLELAAGGVRRRFERARRWRRASRRWDRRRRPAPGRRRGPAPTKRAMLSTWPSVWSFFRPSSIQMTFSRAEGFARARPRPAAWSSRCGSGSSSDWRVVSTVPSPSWSTAPPSSTKSKRCTGVPATRAMSSPTVASSCRSYLPPQLLVGSAARRARCACARRSARCRAARCRRSAPARTRRRRPKPPAPRLPLPRR